MPLVNFNYVGSYSSASLAPAGEAGTLEVPGYRGLGRVVSQNLVLSSEFAVAAVLPDDRPTGAKLSAVLSITFTPGAGTPDFAPQTHSYNGSDTTPISEGQNDILSLGWPQDSHLITLPAFNMRVDHFDIDVEMTGSASLSYGGAPADLLVEPGWASSSATIVFLVAPKRGTAGADVFNGTKHDDVVALLAGNDRFDGRGGNDHIYGGAGHDRLAGGNGDDFLYGGAGNDSLNGGKGADRLEGGLGADLLTGASGADYLYGGGSADRLFGGAGDDVLYGGSGADRIQGGAGVDRITGGAGADLMWGGAGRDTFVFLAVGDSPAGAGFDRIMDFNPGLDRIDLRGVDANTSLAGDQSFALAGMTPAAHAVWIANNAAGFMVQVDVNGDAKADMSILLDGLFLTADPISIML